jgi:hypothetical protein
MWGERAGCASRGACARTGSPALSDPIVAGVIAALDARLSILEPGGGAPETLKALSLLRRICLPNGKVEGSPVRAGVCAALLNRPPTAARVKAMMTQQGLRVLLRTLVNQSSASQDGLKLLQAIEVVGERAGPASLPFLTLVHVRARRVSEPRVCGSKGLITLLTNVLFYLGDNSETAQAACDALITYASQTSGGWR